MTERQEKFIDEYILTGNGAEAARRAGYTETFANRQGHKLLSKPEVRAAIDERLQVMKTSKILEERQLLEWLSAVVTGEVKDEQLMTKLTGRGCSQIERHEVRNLNARLKAADMLLKVAGAYQKNEPEQSGDSLFIATLEKIWTEEPEIPTT